MYSIDRQSQEEAEAYTSLWYLSLSLQGFSMSCARSAKAWDELSPFLQDSNGRESHDDDDDSDASTTAPGGRLAATNGAWVGRHGR
jgi:hypothetical protein